MRKITALILAAGLICIGCKEETHKFIAPLPSGLDVENLTDCMVPAEFTTADFNWMGGNLTMTVFNEDFYDTVELHQMQAGDTLVFDSYPIVVETIEESDGYIIINSFREQEQEILLEPGDGGTYRAVQFDDHSIYTELGKAQIPLAENFKIIDCGINPTDPSITVETDQKLYLESLEDYRQHFSCLDTEVLIENGVITEIHRNWIP